MPHCCMHLLLHLFSGKAGSGEPGQSASKDGGGNGANAVVQLSWMLLVSSLVVFL